MSTSSARAEIAAATASGSRRSKRRRASANSWSTVIRPAMSTDSELTAGVSPYGVRRASSEMLVTPYFCVALSARSDTNRYSLFSRKTSTSKPASSIVSR